MLRELRIQNFKGWKDTGLIRMAPITLFFGTNSSGKSSIGHFLMLLKQTVESADRKAVFNLGDKNSSVQLGSYKDMVFNHETSNDICFEYERDIVGLVTGKKAEQFEKIIGTNRIRYPSLILTGEETERFDVIVGLNENHYPIVKQLKYLFQSGSKNNSIVMERISRDELKYKVVVDSEQIFHNKSDAPYKYYGFPDDVITINQKSIFMKEINYRHEQWYRSLYYLGPLRAKAERIYKWTGIEPESVGFTGENTVDAIISSQQWSNAIEKKERLTIDKIVAQQLKRMELIEGFAVNSISTKRQEYEVKVQAKGSNDWVDLPDVGFGISQVLPILVQCYFAPYGSSIIMEQPDIHLHPRAQSLLADVLIDIINKQNIQLIIETHSEHFLRRLQRRIAEGVIPQEKVAAYFANINKSPAKLEPLEIDEYGNILNWPENFFGDEMGDIAAHAEAALKKRRKKINGKVKA